MHESKLNQLETLQIISTWNGIVNDRFNCAACLKSTTKEHREKKKFCVTPSKDVIGKYNDSFRYYRCPGSFSNRAAYEMLMLHGLFESGHLPYDGGILDQPAKFIDAMRLISSLKFEHSQDMESKQKKWQTTRSASNSPSKSRKLSRA